MISQTDKVTRLVDVKKNRQTPNMSNDSNWVQTKPSKTWLIRPAASKCTVITSAIFCLFESRFWEGPLLARATETDEHIMVTSLGMFTTRTIRTEKDQELCSSDLIKGMRDRQGHTQRRNIRRNRMPDKRRRSKNRWHDKKQIIHALWEPESKTASCDRSGQVPVQDKKNGTSKPQNKPTKTSRCEKKRNQFPKTTNDTDKESHHQKRKNSWSRPRWIQWRWLES